MSRVTIHCQGYPPAFQHFNRNHDMDVTPWRFMIASLTLGFQRFWAEAGWGPRLWLHRLGLGMSGMSFLEDEYGQLRLADDYRHLDGSEKVAMSYWQGMVFAKLAAEEALGVRWLVHADALERRRMLTRTAGAKKRADMVGQDDQLNWHVIEAKGYSNAYTAEKLTKAKTQAGVVARINHQPPATTSASITSLWTSPIHVLLDDPPPPGKEHWNIPDPGFWQHYYGGIADYIMKSRKPEQHPEFPGFTFATLTPVVGAMPRKVRPKEWQPLMIGLPDDLLNDASLAPKSHSAPYCPGTSRTNCR